MSPEQEKRLVVGDVKPRLRQVHATFEDVLRDIVTTYFEDRPINKQTVPDIVRDKAKHLLEKNEKYKVEYELEDLPRNGLSLVCRGSYYRKYIIKILFSPDGKLPIVGMTGRKKRILCQRSQQQPLWSYKDIYPIHSLKDQAQETLVLVILWNARFVNGIAYQDLLLVRPIEGKNSQPMIYWSDPIGEPADDLQEVEVPDGDLEDDFGISFDVS